MTRLFFDLFTLASLSNSVYDAFVLWSRHHYSTRPSTSGFFSALAFVTTAFDSPRLRYAFSGILTQLGLRHCLFRHRHLVLASTRLVFDLFSPASLHNSVYNAFFLSAFASLKVNPASVLGSGLSGTWNRLLPVAFRPLAFDCVSQYRLCFFPPLYDLATA